MASAINRSAPGEPWPEADLLFQSDPRWLGGDDAYSVDLGSGRTLWLFGDTFVGDGSNPSRRAAAFPRNSIGIQQGTDPSGASIRFYWSEATNAPTSFFDASPTEHWLWPLHGIMIQDRLLLFFMKVRSPSDRALDAIADWRELGPLGFFDVYDWEAIIVENPGDEPGQWTWNLVVSRPETRGVIIGAALATSGDFLYAYGWRGGDGYLLRWPIDCALASALEVPEWWVGGAWGAKPADAAVVLPDVKTEFTVHFDPQSSQWRQTQVVGPIGDSIASRWADRPEGPWSDLESFFVPEESSRPGVMIYAAKAHPQLSGAGLVLTYASNGRDVEETLDDDSIYFPRFVKVVYEEGS